MVGQLIMVEHTCADAASCHAIVVQLYWMHNARNLASGSPKGSTCPGTIIWSTEVYTAGVKHEDRCPKCCVANGIASHIHDYDDTHLETIIHPGRPVASAILAYPQHEGKISGQNLLTALVVGIEAECKVGLSVWPSHYDVGWHITSSTGSIGAAVGVGRLMDLEPEWMAHVMGLAAVQVTGLREMFGSDTKSFHVGRAAQAGRLAALLAEKGFTSSESALEAKRGWANVVVCGGEPQLDRSMGELGQIWETDRNSFKLFPCGIVKHPAIDAAIQIRKKLNIEAEQPVAEVIKHLHVHCQVHPLVIELTNKVTACDGLETKQVPRLYAKTFLHRGELTLTIGFSVAHGVAVGLIYGKAGPAQYSDDVVRGPVVIAVRDRVKATASENLQSDEAIVTIMDETATIAAEVHIQHALGSLEKPLNNKLLEEKFVDQVALSLGKDAARRASLTAWSILGAGDVSESLNMLP